jgi:hypothetical protein
MKIVARILSFPFIIAMYAIVMNLMVLQGAYLYLRYGGEFLVYMNDDKPTIEKIYESLKDNEVKCGFCVNPKNEKK